MGGALAVTIVDPDGVWHKMTRWTNATPWHFTDPRFLSGDPVVLKFYLDTWHQMVQEYDDFHNGVVGAAEPAMSRMYCDPENSARDMVVPDGYGLVFLDIPNHRLWDMQQYTTYQRVSALRIVMDAQDWVDMDPDELAKDRLHYESMLPFIHVHRTPVSRTNQVDVEVKFASVDELIAPATQMNNRRSAKGGSDWSYYVLDMTGWDCRSFDMGSDGSRAFKAALEGIGYQFNQREQDRWNEWISDAIEMEDEAS